MASKKSKHDNQDSTLAALRNQIKALETERDELHTRLEESQTQWLTLFEGAGDSIFIVEPRTMQILNANENAARRLGYTREALLNLRLDAIESYEPQDPNSSSTVWRSTYTGTLVYECWHKHQDGSFIPVEVSSRFVGPNNQQVLLSFARDITERKEMENQRIALATERERIRVLTAFNQAASQELRTPLSVIRTALYLITNTPSPEKQSEKLEVIKQQTMHIENLVESILTMSQLDSSPSLSPQTHDITSLLHMVITRLESAIEDKQLAVELDIAPDLPPIHGDQRMLVLALKNLVQNAIDYTPPGGQITLSVANTGLDIQITIADNGIGIASEALPYIFERFYREDQARTARKAGLGLPIAQRIISLHEGEITVESTPKEGSRFIITLPIT